jgi:hypothetical protein
MGNFKIIYSEQAGSINNYQHTKYKMLKTKAAEWFSRANMTEACIKK